MRRVAGTRPIECDQAKAVELAEERVPKLVKLCAQPMDKQDRTSLALFYIVYAVSIDINEPAGGRHHPLRFGGDPSCENDEIGGHQYGADGQCQQYPGRD